MNHPFSRLTKTPKAKHPLYNRWTNLKQLIYNPNHTNYKFYGGKGITLDKSWENNYLVFLVWCTKNGYAKDLVLTRKDKNKGFTPDNTMFCENNHSTEPFKI